MLSGILTETDPANSLFSDLNQVTVSNLVIVAHDLAVDPHGTVMDLFPRLAPGRSPPQLVDHLHDGPRAPHGALGDLLGQLPAAKAAVEIVLGSPGGLLAV